MSATTKVQAIARIFEHVPLPIVAQVAQGLDDVLTLIEQEHHVDLTDFRDALVAAREPWQRIHDTATKSAADLGFPHGSTGE